ncbi:MAG: hypothetical protein Phog2KO_09790 [Phototrophicaceae bacterium]
MINLIRAEILKSIKNVPVTFFLIGAIPVVAFAMLNVIGITTALGLIRNAFIAINGQEQVILAFLFANQLIAQILFIILSAISFGGEYNWKTWKNILPRHQRSQIIISKFIVIILGILIAIQATGLMTYIGAWEYALVTGIPFNNGAWGDGIIPFWTQYIVMTFCLLATYLLGAIYASIASIRFQSISAGIVIGVTVAFADTIAQATFNLLSRLLTIESIADIASFLPQYNIQNILSWITTGAPVYRWNLFMSSSLVLIWIGAGVGLAVYLFRIQDIE